MEIDPGYGWDDETEALRKQLQDMQLPAMLDEIEKARQRERERLRREIRKLGGKPCR